jgi:glutathione S-transferase
MSRLRLYWRPGTCARIAFTALEEIGAPFEDRMLNKFRGETESAEYLAVNPKGMVPALQVDDWVVTENPAVLRALHEMFPEAQLLPAADHREEIEAAETMAWFASYSMHGSVGRQRFPEYFSLSRDPEALEAIRLDARQELTRNFAIVERRLEDREWLFGRWTILDVYLLYLWWRGVGGGVDPTPFPRLADHGRRCEQRPTLAKVIDREEAEWRTFEAEGLVPDDWAPNYVGRIPSELIPPAGSG